MVGQSNVWYYLVMLTSTCSQMYRAVVITAKANVRWAYRSVLQAFMAFSVSHTHAEHAGFSHVVLYYVTVNVKKN